MDTPERARSTQNPWPSSVNLGHRLLLAFDSNKSNKSSHVLLAILWFIWNVHTLKETCFLTTEELAKYLAKNLKNPVRRHENVFIASLVGFKPPQFPAGTIWITLAYSHFKQKLARNSAATISPFCPNSVYTRLL